MPHVRPHARSLALLLSLTVAAPSIAAAQGAPPGAPAASTAAPKKGAPAAASTAAPKKGAPAAAPAAPKKATPAEAAAAKAKAKELRAQARSLRGEKKYAASYAAWSELRKGYEKTIGFVGVLEADKALRDLAALTGTIEVKAPEGAEVKLDGASVGTAPLAAPVRVDPGAHALEVAKAGFEPWTRSVDVAAKQAAVVEAALAPEKTTGTVAVREQTGAPSVRVFVDDNDVGPAPWEGELPPGQHVVELRGAGTASAKQPIEVAAKSRQEIVLQAVASHAPVSVSATPASARIAIDGREVGTGTWKGDLDVGSHTIAVTAPGFAQDERTVEVTGDRPISVDVALVAGAAAAAAPAKPSEKGAEPKGKKGERGVYVGLDLFAGWPTRIPGYGCAPGGVCTHEPGYPSTKLPGPNAGALLLRIGYRRDWLGFELVGAGLGDAFLDSNEYKPTTVPNTSSAQIDDSYARKEGWLRYSYGGFGGLGVRAIAPVPLEPTAGLALGAVYRHITLVRKVEGSVSDTFTASDSYVAPALQLDAAFRLAFVRIGVLARVELAGERETDAQPGYTVDANGSQKIYPTPAYSLTRGSAQIFLGPTFGLIFGK